MQLTLSAALVFLLGQVAAGPAQSAQSSKATIEGKVLQSATGLPVPAARVTVVRQGRPGLTPSPGRGGTLPASPQPPSASTDENGNFVLHDLDQGTYTLQIQGNGYVEQTYGQRYAGGPGIPVTLAPGEHLKELRIT